MAGPGSGDSEIPDTNRARANRLRRSRSLLASLGKSAQKLLAPGRKRLGEGILLVSSLDQRSAIGRVLCLANSRADLGSGGTYPLKVGLDLLELGSQVIGRDRSGHRLFLSQVAARPSCTFCRVASEDRTRLVASRPAGRPRPANSRPGPVVCQPGPALRVLL